MRTLLEVYAGCSIAHVLCRWIDCLAYGQQFQMTVEDVLTGWWPILARAATEIAGLVF